MSSHPQQLPNKESIRAQLKELGYANVPDEVLDEFMVDLAKLYQKQATPSSDSYGWSTEESDYEQRSMGGRQRRVTSEGGSQRGTRAEQVEYSRERPTQQQHQHYQHQEQHQQQYQHQQQQQHQHRHQHQSQQQNYYQQEEHEYSEEHQQHQPHPPRHHVHNHQRPTHHHPPPQHHHHRAASYKTSERKYDETESAEERMYDGGAYMPSHGIHISPHQSTYPTHTPIEEKENYHYGHGQTTNHQPTRAQGPAYAPAAPRHQQPVYESDYSSAANNEEYTSDEPYYSEPRYPYQTSVSSRPYKTTTRDEYYSEDDTASRPLSSMSYESSRYPGGNPNTYGVIWARNNNNVAGRTFPKSDPVSRHQEVQRRWSQDPFLRSQSSNKNPKVHIAYDPPWKAARKDLSLMRPAYVVPTEKRRDSLRFNVRAKMMS